MKIWLYCKSISLICIVLIIAGFAYVSAKEIINHFNIRNELVKEEMVRLSENIVSQKVQDSAALLNDRISQLDGSIIELTKQRNQQITAVGEVVARLESEIRDAKSNLYKNDEDPEKTFDQTVVYTKDAKGEDFPLAHVLYNPFLEGDDKWTTRSYPLTFKTKLIIAESGDRKDVIAETTMRNDTIKKYRGIDKPLKIQSVEWVERSKRWMFNLRFALNVNITDDLYPGLGLTWFSYGKTKRDMDWKFINMGIGYNDTFHLYLAPAEYNIGNHIPIVENMFVGPFIGLDDNSKVEYGGIFSIPF